MNSPESPAPPAPPPVRRTASPPRSAMPGTYVSAIPPFYANAFDVEVGDYDVSIRFRQRDPYFEAQQAQMDESVRAQLDTQLPAAIVAMSHQAAKALLEELSAKVRQ